MTKIYCSGCGRLVAEVELLEEGEVVNATCSGCVVELVSIDTQERALGAMNLIVFGNNGPKPQEEGE